MLIVELQCVNGRLATLLEYTPSQTFSGDLLKLSQLIIFRSIFLCVVKNKV